MRKIKLKDYEKKTRRPSHRRGAARREARIAAQEDLSFLRASIKVGTPAVDAVALVWRDGLQ